MKNVSRFERALRDFDPDVSLVYWDSNLDSVLGQQLASRSILWSHLFAGNGDGDVTIGPFAYWSVEDANDMQGGRRVLHRNLTNAPPQARTMPALMPDHAITHFLRARNMRDVTWFIDPTFESHHGAVHNWVGGVMADVPISPADPIFFMHHAFIDCLWEQQRFLQQRRFGVDPRFDYPNDSYALGVRFPQPDGQILRHPSESYHRSLATMQPFGNIRNIDGLSDVYFDHYYTCHSSPTCSRSRPHCGSPYLFCDVTQYRCAPKLMEGAECGEFAESDVCYEGTCCNRVCERHCHVRRERKRDFRRDLEEFDESLQRFRRQHEDIIARLHQNIVEQ